MNNETKSQSEWMCSGCGTLFPKRLLCCPSCDRLVHGDRLRMLAMNAEDAMQCRKIVSALQSWREALELLPQQSRQASIIEEKIRELSSRTEGRNGRNGKHRSNDNPVSHTTWTKKFSGLGVIALVIWKFKFIAAFILGKGKLLLLGLSKSSTVFTMLLSMGVYWVAWGWKFAFGLVISIYIHEMGHIAALRRYGYKVDAPMFVPGLGAMIRLKQRISDAKQDARVGLAGPFWGLGAAIIAYIIYYITDWGSWGAIAQIGAWINLFNLLPVWQLDGGRAFNAISRSQRWIIVLTTSAMWWWTNEGMLVLLMLVAGGRALLGPSTKKNDQVAFCQYMFLLVILSAMTVIHVNLPNSQ